MKETRHIKVVDFNNNVYECTYQMCKAYGIDQKTFTNRMDNGWSIRDALTVKPQKIKKPCTDYLGNEFESKSAMCEYHGVKVNVFDHRINNGWSLKDALTKRINKKEEKLWTDHLGNKYRTKKRMCDDYNISTSVFDNRIHKHWGVKKALTTEVRGTHIWTDDEGNEFSSKKEMCDEYGVNVGTFDNRIAHGATIKEALRQSERLSQFEFMSCQDPLGNIYGSVDDMCKDWKVPKTVFMNRINNRWTVKEALETPVKSNKI